MMAVNNHSGIEGSDIVATESGVVPYKQHPQWDLLIVHRAGRQMCTKVHYNNYLILCVVFQHSVHFSVEYRIEYIMCPSLLGSVNR